MIIKHVKDPFYHIVIEEVFDALSLSAIYEEINHMKENLESEKFTGSATDIYNNTLKKNKGIFVSGNKKFQKLVLTSSIRNLIEENSNKKYWKNNTLHRIYKSLDWGSTLLNCYGKDDYYKPHIDDGIFTILIFIYQNYENKNIGGDLYFPEYDFLHRCNNNQSIIFLSKELHGVTPIVNDDFSNRYSIVTFSREKDKII